MYHITDFWGMVWYNMKWCLGEMSPYFSRICTVESNILHIMKYGYEICSDIGLSIGES